MIVVGAGEGVGLAGARRFAAGGYDIGLLARDAARTEAMAKRLTDEGANVGWSAVDVTDDAALSTALATMTEHTGRVDVLLYNAVAARGGNLLDLSAADLLADVHAGAAGLLTAVKSVYPLLQRQHTGTVLATGSGTADRPYPAAPTVGMQKGALRSLVRGLAADLRPIGVHVATVTVNGTITPGTALSPEAIAGTYWDLVQETTGDPENWRTVVDLRR
jgi:NADP-dependent 3-hydroxy acid dehydrogenase YdfG